MRLAKQAIFVTSMVFVIGAISVVTYLSVAGQSIGEWVANVTLNQRNTIVAYVNGEPTSYQELQRYAVVTKMGEIFSVPQNYNPFDQLVLVLIHQLESDVLESAKMTLMQEKQEEYWQSYINSLRKDAEVRIIDKEAIDSLINATP